MEILKRATFEIKTLTPDLYPATLTLYKNIFGGKTEYSPYIRMLMAGELSPWEWKYGANSVRVVAVRGKEIIGHVGAVIRTFSILGEDVLGAELTDGVIKSIFPDAFALKAILERLEKELIAKGVQLAILFPNQNSRLLVNRRAILLADVPFFEKQIQKNKDGHDDDNLRITTFVGQELSKIFNVVNSRYILTKRTPEYLNKRFLENPFEQYRAFLIQEKGTILGYVVLKKHRNEQGHIVDLVTTSEEKMSSLIDFSEWYLANWGGTTISLYGPTPQSSELLSRLGYKRRRWRPFALLLSKTNPLTAGVKIMDNWYLTMSEHGIF